MQGIAIDHLRIVAFATQARLRSGCGKSPTARQYARTILQLLLEVCYETLRRNPLNTAYVGVVLALNNIKQLVDARVAKLPYLAQVVYHYTLVSFSTLCYILLDIIYVLSTHIRLCFCGDQERFKNIKKGTREWYGEWKKLSKGDRAATVLIIIMEVLRVPEFINLVHSVHINVRGDFEE